MEQGLELLPLVFSALLSSCFTLLGLYVFSRVFFKKKLKKQVDQAGLLIKKRLQEGVIDAAKEVLPDFREEVRQGFTDALARALSGEIIPQTARQLAKNSQDIRRTRFKFFAGPLQSFF